jgi:fatty acid desaturase
MQGLPGLLCVAFVTLKLCGVIAWSWWWVLAPVWVGIPVLALLFSVGVILGMVADEREERKARARRASRFGR